MLDITEENSYDLYYNVEECVKFCKSIPNTVAMRMTAVCIEINHP